MSELSTVPYVVSDQVRHNPLGLNYPLNRPIYDDHHGSKLTYNTTLKAFCASRVDDVDIRRTIASTDDPKRIAILAQSGVVVPAWDACKEFYLSTLLRHQYADPYFRRHLMDTDPAPIVVSDTSLISLWPDAHDWIGKFLTGLRRTFHNAVRFG